ncbi:DNA/RNA nuclease SfsA [Pelotalea chapellei]|uniref:Sugar fermentation stimulation protein homolog n=1 Tax=Pelotalea chapellei TaxID=44671 RepID=A0ABS5U556_9BACT|nr:DNA/RNA nuclease SfsA [Pelotalea chapellei]
MKLPPLITGVLVKRYKRFLADVILEDGSLTTVHCPNSGSMKGCAEPGSRVYLSRSPNLKRALPLTWELVESCGVWAGINTCLPNRLTREAIENGAVVELQGYTTIRPEVPYGEASRIDLLLENSEGRCFVEVKNVTLVDDNRALFPDAVTTRGQKHLHELMRVVREGDRGVIFFTVQRSDGHSVSPADLIDPEYGRLLRQAIENGVEALAYRAVVTPQEIVLTERLPVLI